VHACVVCVVRRSAFRRAAAARKRAAAASTTRRAATRSTTRTATAKLRRRTWPRTTARCTACATPPSWTRCACARGHAVALLRILAITFALRPEHASHALTRAPLCGAGGARAAQPQHHAVARARQHHALLSSGRKRKRRQNARWQRCFPRRAAARHSTCMDGARTHARVRDAMLSIQSRAAAVNSASEAASLFCATTRAPRNKRPHTGDKTTWQCLQQSVHCLHMRYPRGE
jgi:hypothetical protein